MTEQHPMGGARALVLALALSAPFWAAGCIALGAYVLWHR